jgi:hypothetical protein
MSAALEAYYKALRKVEVACLRLLAGELSLDAENASVTGLAEAESAVPLAARDLTRAVDGLPVGDRPKGWDS